MKTTIARRIEEIGANISEQLQSKADTFEYFSLVFDESCDMSGTAQLSVFIQDLPIHEDLVKLISLHDTTLGVDIKEAVVNAFLNKIPKFDKFGILL